MKHNLLKSLIISVILLMGVSNAWALDIYLDISNFNWSENSSVIKLYPGTGSDVQGTKLPSGVYKFTVPSATETIYFKQYNSSGTGYPSNQASIDYDASHNNVYRLIGWDAVENADYNISIATPTNYIYFDNSTTEWGDNKYFVIGHDKPSLFSRAHSLTNIENTLLWYTTQGYQWDDATFYSFLSNQSWDNGDNKWGINAIQAAKGHTAPFTSHKNLNANKYYLCVPTSKEKNQPFDISEHSSYTSLNYTQTIKSVVKPANGSYAPAASKATINITSYKLTSDNTTTQQTASISTSASSATITAARTATTTLTVSNNIETGYNFDGWYDAETGGNLLSPSTTYTYYPTSATTIYARFSEYEFVVRGGEQFGNTWENNNNVMTKKDESEKIVYYTVSIAEKNNTENVSNEAFHFKIYNKTTREWYGLAANIYERFWYTRYLGEHTLVAGDSGKNIELRADVPGDYVIKVDYSNKEPKITITYPIIPTINFRPHPGGSISVTYTDENGIIRTKADSEEGGFTVYPGSSFTFNAIANEGYQFNTLYIKRGAEEKDRYPEKNQLNLDTVICNSDITLIPEFTNTREYVVFLSIEGEEEDWIRDNTGIGLFIWRDHYSIDPSPTDWVKMEKLNNRLYKCTIPYDPINQPKGWSTFRFVHIKQEGYNIGEKPYDPSNNGLNWDNALGYTVDHMSFKEFTDGNNCFIIKDEVGEIYGGSWTRIAENGMKTVYLDLSTKLIPSGTYDDDNAKELASYWTKNNAAFRVHYDGEDHELIEIDHVRRRYHKIELPIGEEITFKRVNPTNTETVWNQIPTHVPAVPTDLFAVIGNNEGSWSIGEWREIPTRKIMIDPFPYGKYGIKVNGTTFWNEDENINTLYLPLGTEVEIIDLDPTHDFWAKNPKYPCSVIANPIDSYTMNEIIDFRYTIYSDMYFCPNYGIKNNYRVYLHLPNTKIPNTDKTFVEKWNSLNSNYKNFIYAEDYLSNGKLEVDGIKKGQLIYMTKDDHLSSLGKGEYWYIDIPAGYHTFRFERKEDQIGVGTRLGARSKHFNNFVMPFEEGNCYTLNSYDGKETFTGSWGKEGLPQCTVTLGYTDVGRYGVKNLNTGDTYYATTTNPGPTFTVPYGTPLEILEGEVGEELKDTYSGEVGLITADGKSVEQRFFNPKAPISNIITITRDSKFDDLFGFKPGVEMYIAVPKDNNTFKNWTTCNNSNHTEHEIYIWADRPYEGRKQIPKTGVIETNTTLYYKFDGEDIERVYKFDFQRKEGINSNSPHAQTIEFICPDISPANCFIMDGTKPDNKDGGYWGYVEITVTLDPFPYGSYGVKYDGKTYMSDPVNEVYIHNVPFGAQVQVIEAVSNTPEYSHKLTNNGDRMYTSAVVVKPDPSSAVHSIEAKNNYMHTISGITHFYPNMVTTKPHTTYLHIPQDIVESWDGEDSYTTYVWATERLTNGGQGRPGGHVKMTKVEEISGKGQGDYYFCEIPEGYNKFYYERKEQQEGLSYNKTVDLIYQIPLIESLNCYSLYPGQNTDPYKGTWVEAPARVGDYRLLYAEKELIKTNQTGEGDLWETAFRMVYSHPSNIIRKVAQDEASSNTVSLHINTSQMRNSKKVHPMVILQRYQTVNSKEQWVDIESHTVLPLEAEGNMAMLPGRKKTYGEFPFYSNGIDNITNDTTYEYRGHAGSGVWNFVVNQGSDGSVELVLPQTERYQGTYYIRTEAINSWNDYNNIACDMTRSTYAEKYSGFSHYYCDWLLKDKDVKFVVANEFDHAISDPFTADTYTDNGVLTENANVRFSWENMTNNVSRAYIQGTWSTDREPPLRLDNIELNYKPADDEANKETLLYDSGNWIYAINLDKVKVGSVLNSLTAEYPVESGNIQTFANDLQMLVGDNNNKSNYIVRVLYDFKINKTLVALVPNESNANIAIDVLIERIDQEEATQVVRPIESSKRNIVDGNETPGSTVYGVFTFTKEHLTDEGLSDQEKLTYWFSLPFDVLLSDIFGFGEVGKSWMIKYYDGEDRANTGLTDDNTFWKYITKRSTVLKANKGYVLSLNKQLMNKNNAIYTNSDTISLYFPSQNLVTSIDNGFTVEEDQVIEIPQWTGETAKKEWNWNLIGMPSYANKSQEITQDHLYYFFDYNHKTDSYTPCWIGEKEFKSMFAYMVQFAGTINWHTFNTEPSTPREIAAQRTSEEKKHVLRIDLMHNAQREDRTYIQLMDEKATADFDMNLDLTKMVNDNANIYSLVGNHQLAANVLPMEATTVPLGVIIKTAGEYTFSMPDGTDGIVAELIDYQTNTRTNLALDNYTVTLPAGTNHTRFAISLQPDKTVTGIEDEHWTADGTQVRKFLIDGRLYMQKDGVLYDAQGREIVNN